MISTMELDKQRNKSATEKYCNKIQNRKTNSIENKARKLHVFILLMIIP